MPAKKEQNNIPAEKIALYDKLIAATSADIERKGANIPYTSCNGHMFSQLDENGSLVLRLPKKELDLFLGKYNTSLHVAYGISRKEYVVVPDELFKNTRELKEYFSMSYEYVKRLKPKPGKKA